MKSDHTEREPTLCCKDQTNIYKNTAARRLIAKTVSSSIIITEKCKTIKGER